MAYAAASKMLTVIAKPVIGVATEAGKSFGQDLAKNIVRPHPTTSVGKYLLGNTKAESIRRGQNLASLVTQQSMASYERRKQEQERLGQAAAQSEAIDRRFTFTNTEITINEKIKQLVETFGKKLMNDAGVFIQRIGSGNYRLRDKNSLISYDTALEMIREYILANNIVLEPESYPNNAVKINIMGRSRNIRGRFTRKNRKPNNGKPNNNGERNNARNTVKNNRSNKPELL